MERRITYRVPEHLRRRFVSGIKEEENKLSHITCERCDLIALCDPTIVMNGVMREDREFQVKGTVGIIKSDSCALVESDWNIV